MAAASSWPAESGPKLKMSAFTRQEATFNIDRTAVLFIGSGETAGVCASALAARRRNASTRTVAASEASNWLRGYREPMRVNGHTHLPGRIVIALDDRRGQVPVEELVHLRFQGVRVQHASAFLEEMTGKVPVRSIRPSDLAFGRGFTGSIARRVLKPASEWVLAVLLLLAVSPVLAIAALAILLETGRPILFKQARVGRRGRVFDVIKLRTMRQDAEAAGPQFAGADDPRITRVGRFLRKTRIDEMPQFLNVIRGEMALIGPRPERPVFVRRFSELSPYFALRHSVRPGITGWAQVEGGYAANDDEAIEKLSYDLYYIKHFSFRLDVKIMLRTIRTMLGGDGR